jgi:hypothetical protein
VYKVLKSELESIAFLQNVQDKLKSEFPEFIILIQDEKFITFYNKKHEFIGFLRRDCGSFALRTPKKDGISREAQITLKMSKKDLKQIREVLL